MRYFLFPINGSDLINRVVDGGTEAPMHAEYGIVDDGGKGKIVKNVGAVSPNIEGTILP